MPYRRILYGTHSLVHLAFCLCESTHLDVQGNPRATENASKFRVDGGGGATCSYRDGRCVHGDTLMATEEKKIFPNLEISAAILFFLTCVHYKKASF